MNTGPGIVGERSTLVENSHPRIGDGTDENLSVIPKRTDSIPDAIAKCPVSPDFAGGGVGKCPVIINIILPRKSDIANGKRSGVGEGGKVDNPLTVITYACSVDGNSSARIITKRTPSQGNAVSTDGCQAADSDDGRIGKCASD